MSGFLGMLGGLMGSSGQLPGGASPQQASGLLGSLLSSVGGVQGLLGMAQQAGLGGKVQSWIGSGANQPISAGEVSQMVPQDQIEQLAQAHGIPAGIVPGLLAHILPHAVDQATPDGTAAGAQDDFAGPGQR